MRAVQTAALLAESVTRSAATQPEGGGPTRVAVDGSGRATPLAGAAPRRRGDALELRSESHSSHSSHTAPQPRGGGARPAAADDLEELLFGTEAEVERRLQRMQARTDASATATAAGAPRGGGKAAKETAKRGTPKGREEREEREKTEKEERQEKTEKTEKTEKREKREKGKAAANKGSQPSQLQRPPPQAERSLEEELDELLGAGTRSPSPVRRLATHRPSSPSRLLRLCRVA